MAVLVAEDLTPEDLALEAAEGGEIGIDSGRRRRRDAELGAVGEEFGQKRREPERAVGEIMDTCIGQTGFEADNGHAHQV